MLRRAACATWLLSAFGLLAGCGLDREGLLDPSTGGASSGGLAGSGGTLIGSGGFGGGFTGGTGAGGASSGGTGSASAGGGQAGALSTGGAAGAPPSGGTGGSGGVGATGGAAGTGGTGPVGGSGGVAQGGTGGGEITCPGVQPTDGANCSTAANCVYGDALSPSQCTCFGNKWQCNPCPSVLTGPCSSQGDVCLYGGGTSCRCSGYQTYGWLCSVCPTSQPTAGVSCVQNRAAVCLYGSVACACDYSGGRNGSWNWSCK